MMTKNLFRLLLAQMLISMLSLPLSVQAEVFPTTSYELSSDGKTLLKWLGEESVIDMTKDPVFNQVTEIGDEAFAYNSTFTYIKLSESVTSIGTSSFNLSTALETVILPKGLESIGEKSFRKCNQLKSIDIPTKVTTLGAFCFENCERLVEVVVPSNIKTFGRYAFADCYALERVTLEKGIKELGFSAFNYCTALTSIEVPEGITEIPDYTFAHCTNLANVTLPSTLTAIGENAFAFGDKIASVTCHAVKAPKADDGAWYGIKPEAVLYVPSESVGAYIDNSSWSAFRSIRPIDGKEDELAWYLLTNDSRRIDMEKVGMFVAADDAVNFAVLDNSGNIIADDIKWARFVQLSSTTAVEPLASDEKTNLLKSLVGGKLTLIGAKSDILIYNVNGVKMLQVVPTEKQTVINVGHLATDTYIVKCGSQTFKFIKK